MVDRIESIQRIATTLERVHGIRHPVLDINFEVEVEEEQLIFWDQRCGERD